VGRRTRWLIAGGVLAVLLVAILFALSDAAELRRRAADLRWEWAGAAAALAVLSYGGMGAYNAAVLRSLGHPVPLAATVRATFVSVVVSRSLRSGGASGAAVLAWVLGRHGVTGSSVVTTVIGHAVQTNAAFAALTLAALTMVTFDDAVRTRLDGRAYLAFVGLAALLLTSLAILVAAMSSRRVRGRAERVVGRAASLAGRLLRRPHWGPGAGTAVHRALEAATFVVVGPGVRLPSWALACARVASSALAFVCCTRAAGIEVGAAGALLAYCAAKLAGTLSFVPGGLGTVELSLVGVLAAFGAPYEAAVLAALVNRVAYHLVPMAIAALVAGPLLREAARRPDADADPDPARSGPD
jgi:uncharacterized membrane protein YbhN (UPF0104 family)